MDGLIMSLIVGGVCGWIASLLMKTNAQMGILANIVVGIAGGVLGRWLFGVLGLAAFGVLSRMARKGRWCRGRDLNPHGP
jgi:uncharacterized membrane protein YeaQ/YmgE (transglycosylase-associated protein family)